MSNGSTFSCASAARDSVAGPTRTSATPAKPARARLAARHLRVAWLELERDQPAVGGQCPRQPDRRIAGERADLEYPPRAQGSRLQVQEAPQRGRYLDLGHSRGHAVGHGRAQDVVVQPEKVNEMVINCMPAVHAAEDSQPWLSLSLASGALGVCNASDGAPSRSESGSHPVGPIPQDHRTKVGSTSGDHRFKRLLVTIGKQWDGSLLCLCAALRAGRGVPVPTDKSQSDWRRYGSFRL